MKEYSRIASFCNAEKFHFCQVSDSRFSWHINNAVILCKVTIAANVFVITKKSGAFLLPDLQEVTRMGIENPPPIYLIFSKFEKCGKYGILEQVKKAHLL